MQHPGLTITFVCTLILLALLYGYRAFVLTMEEDTLVSSSSAPLRPKNNNKHSKKKKVTTGTKPTSPYLAQRPEEPEPSSLKRGASSTTRGGTQQQDDPWTVAQPLGYLEEPYTNVGRGVRMLCSLSAAYNKTSFRTNWKSLAESYREKDASTSAAKPNAKQMHDKIHAAPHHTSLAFPTLTNPLTGQRMPRLKVLCVTYAHTDALDKLGWMYESWGRHCDHHRAFVRTPKLTGVPDNEVIEIHPVGGDGKQNGWQRIRTICMLLVSAQFQALLDKVDFLLVAGDDAYVILQNLRILLNEPAIAESHRNGVPLLLGHRMLSFTQEPFVSNAVYIMSKTTLRILAALMEGPLCSPSLSSEAEDVPLSSCLKKVGIMPLDLFDEFLEDRVEIFNVHQLAEFITRPNANPWYNIYRNRPVPQGYEAVSVYPIAFHYMDGDKVKQLKEAEKKVL